MLKPVCSKCIYLSTEQPRFRPCPRFPVFHRDMLCSAEKNAFKDHVTGENYKPYCDEVNRHGECLAYYPNGLKKPRLEYDDVENLVKVYGSNPFVITSENKPLTPKMEPHGIYDNELKCYYGEFVLTHTATLKAACILDGVLSETSEIYVEIPDEPEIEFDKSTNTVTIKSYNKAFFTTDGTKVTEESSVYEGPFVIDHNTTVKACSYANEDFSKQVEKYCVSIEPPVIEFDPETNKVTLSADDTIVFSTDGSDLYNDSDVYDEPFEISKNTFVKAACLVDGELSEVVEKECKVANQPEITYDPKTHKVTIKSENPIRYTLDGSNPRKSSTLYEAPFAITESCTVKASSFTEEKQSEVSSLECVYVAPPVITFNDEDNTVTITGENKILYSTDGSNIYDDSDEYDGPFTIEENTVVKAASILDGILSDEVTLECKVPSKPSITFDSKTKTVTIKGENTILYTTDGSDVRKKDAEYKSPFKISATSTIKAKAYVGDKESEQAELNCTI
jgi:hypothetical protein